MDLRAGEHTRAFAGSRHPDALIEPAGGGVIAVGPDTHPPVAQRAGCVENMQDKRAARSLFPARRGARRPSRYAGGSDRARRRRHRSGQARRAPCRRSLARAPQTPARLRPRVSRGYGRFAPPHAERLGRRSPRATRQPQPQLVREPLGKRLPPRPRRSTSPPAHGRSPCGQLDRTRRGAERSARPRSASRGSRSSRSLLQTS